MQELYNQNMEYAIQEREKITAPVKEDDKAHNTRQNKQRHADLSQWTEKRALDVVPKIDRFIKELPSMLAEAKTHGYGPDETFIMRCATGCNCVEKSLSCSGHVFKSDQYFLSWTDYNATCPNSPSSPDSFETQEP